MPSRLAVQVKILPNPWHSLDHEGRPAGACPRERMPNQAPGSHQGYVGAVLYATVPVALEPGHQGTPSQDTVWHFSKEPVAYADPRAYYRKALQNGEVIAADEKSAAAAGLKFLPYDAALAASRAEAVAKWRAAFNEDPPSIDPFVKPVPGVMPGDALEPRAFEPSVPSVAVKKEGK